MDAERLEDAENTQLELQTLMAEKDALQAELNRLLFDRKLEQALAKENVRQVHMVKNLIDADKLTIGDDGGFVDLREQLDVIYKEAPSLFNQPEKQLSTGSTGNFVREKPVDAAENPWHKQSFNMTKQGEIFKKDPELARRLIALAK